MLTRKSVKDSYNAGESIKFFPFYGHKESEDGSYGPECFSQFYPAFFHYRNERYRWAEQFMMAEKARLFGDNVTLAKIMSARNPYEVKRLGREVKNFNTDIWNRHKAEIALMGNHLKFMNNLYMRDALMRTDGYILVEASPSDRIWGIGLRLENPLVHNPNYWNGENLLGFVLTALREDFKNEQLRLRTGRL